MGNKIVTEADRKRTPHPQPLPGNTLQTPGRAAWERLRRTTPSRLARRTRPTTSADSRRFRTIRALTFRTVLLRLHDEGRWKRTFSQGFHRPSFVGCAARSATRACHAYRTTGNTSTSLEPLSNRGSGIARAAGSSRRTRRATAGRRWRNRAYLRTGTA